MTKHLKLSSTLSGIAGEYFVAAELSRRGFVASITLRNTRGIDILVSNADATNSVGVQVKAKQGRGAHWVLNKGPEGFDEEGDSLALAPKGPHKSGTVVISAPAGTTLYYMCAIHPWMQGKIVVT